MGNSFCILLQSKQFILIITQLLMYFEHIECSSNAANLYFNKMILYYEKQLRLGTLHN